MSRLNRSLLILLLLLLCVGCDQLTKDVARRYLAPESPQSWFYDTVRLEYAENPGAFLSLGGGLSQELRVLLFQGFPFLWLALLACGLFFVEQVSTFTVMAWSFVLSGGIGNLLDRLFHDGHVIDFMNIGIGGLRTGIFNVADVCITTGVLFLIIQTIQSSRPPSVVATQR